MSSQESLYRISRLEAGCIKGRHVLRSGGNVFGVAHLGAHLAAGGRGGGRAAVGVPGADHHGVVEGLGTGLDSGLFTRQRRFSFWPRCRGVVEFLWIRLM